MSKTSPEALEAGRWAFAIAIAGLVLLLPLLLWLLGLLLFVVTLGEVRPSGSGLGSLLRGVLIGADNRVSTSKVVAVTWTYAVASALLSIVIAKWLGHDQGYQAQQSGLQAQYALLVGGPLGAAILAKGIVSSQQGGDTGTRAADEAHVSQLVSDDHGNTDLGDLQYVLFNAVALTFFFGEFIHLPTAGLPKIPDVLLGLTSVSAVGYVSKKTLTSLAPAITKIVPPHAKPGDTVTIWGTGLFDVDRQDDGPKPKVTFRSVVPHAHSVVAQVGDMDSEADGLYMAVTVPAGLESGKHKVSVKTLEGRFTQWAKRFTVDKK
jgi:hypothetical protein